MTGWEKLGLLASQALNVVLRGDPDESLSARAYRENRTSWIACIDAVLGRGHCYGVYLQQVVRARNRVSVSR